MIVERPTAKGTMRYLVRVSRNGERTCLGTFDTREEAEQVEAEAGVPRPRKCVDCLKVFTPQTKHNRRVRCSDCLGRRRDKRPKNDDHWLYFCHDSSGELLYIGITSAKVRRFRGHGDVKDWWKDVDHIVIRHFETRGEVVAAERLAIRDLRPKYNVQHARELPSNVIQFPGVGA